MPKLEPGLVKVKIEPNLDESAEQSMREQHQPSVIVKCESEADLPQVKRPLKEEDEDQLKLH